MRIINKGEQLKMIGKKNVLVVGDVMLDTYFTGDVKRISPEAPVPVFWKKSERSVLGGAANVALNLMAAGQNVSVMAMIGKDEPGEKLITVFEEHGIHKELILRTRRRTTEKTRFLATNNQQVLRLDVEDTDPLVGEERDRLLELLSDKIDGFDLILISDYLKGLLTYDFTQSIIQLARNRRIPVVVDVKDPKAEKYRGATLVKPNLKELQDLTGRKAETDAEIIFASEQLRNICQCNYVLTTCGSRGMVLVGDGEPYFVEAYGQEVFDVTGAGDTTIAYIAACMINGLPLRKAIDVANLAAGIQVSKVGTSSVYLSEIRERMAEEEKGTLHKIIRGRDVDTFRKDHADKKVVFTNGCFDILHVGHIRYLQEAAKLGDVLVIGLNCDASVKRLKGPERPVNTEKDRAEMLAALSFIDYVVLFEEDTPLELIKKIQPDVLVKGGDYSNEYVVGTNEVRARGGNLVLIPFVEGKSTTGIIEKIRQ